MKKIAWAKWESVCLPKEKGGLGIRDLGSLTMYSLESGNGDSSITKENYGLDYWNQNMATGGIWRKQQGAVEYQHGERI